MAETFSQIEEAPEDYPNADDNALWQRIEAYCAYRWTPREVVWIVDGPGHWKPPLAPAEISLTEFWQGGTYKPVSIPASPFGGLNFPAYGPYRIKAIVGADNDAPAAVIEAFERLQGYLAASEKISGASRVRRQVGDVVTSYDRSATWIAQALDKSGAADLLRPYRRA